MLNVPWNLNAEFVSIVFLSSFRRTYEAIRLAEHIWCPLLKGFVEEEVVVGRVFRCRIRIVLFDGH